jgi:endonuclease-3
MRRRRSLSSSSASPAAARKRIATILDLLGGEYPHPATALRFSTPFELLVATILSAQSTDAQVNRLTERLFTRYTGVDAYAQAPAEEFERACASVNFYRNKARNIQLAARLIIERFGGEVPRRMEDLVTLPGVARKTANIVLSGAFGVIEGIAVDTHVIRLSGRLGLSAETDPVKIERDLMAITPRERWADLSHLLILHGRSTCAARKPRHADCVLFDICPSRAI